MAPGITNTLTEPVSELTFVKTVSKSKEDGYLRSGFTKVFSTAVSLRLASRQRDYKSFTSGQAVSYLQASPVILPSCYAKDFRLLCARNPVPCPLLAESAGPGVFDKLKSYVLGLSGEKLASDLDLRHDVPRYTVYRNGTLVKDGCTDLMEEWTEDHVTFLIGCSYSFETALEAAGLPPQHVVQNYNCPMYRTSIPLNPSGVFTGTYGVSMRTYKLADIGRVKSITRPFIYTHGEPIAWGWNTFKSLGIHNIDRPEYGDAPLTADGRPLSEAYGDEANVPVFWGCGITPQDSVMRSRLSGTVMCHLPGHTLVLDAHDRDIMDEGV